MVRSGSHVEGDNEHPGAALGDLVGVRSEPHGYPGVVVVPDCHRGLVRGSLRHPRGQRPEGQLHALIVVVHRILCGAEGERPRGLSRMEGDAGRNAGVVVRWAHAALLGLGERDGYRALRVRAQRDFDRGRAALGGRVGCGTERHRHLRVVVVSDIHRGFVPGAFRHPRGQRTELQPHALVVVIEGVLCGCEREGPGGLPCVERHARRDARVVGGGCPALVGADDDRDGHCPLGVRAQ